MNRSTKQRAAITAAFDMQPGRLWSPKELLTEVQQRVPGIGIATVYRNLKHLFDSREIRAVPMLGQPDRYQCSRGFFPGAILVQPDGTVVALPDAECAQQVASREGYRINITSFCEAI